MSKKHQPPFENCPCCNPAINILTQAFLSRRQFMVLGTGAFAATVALSGGSNANPIPTSIPTSLTDASADTIYINAEVITVNDLQPNAEAVAVKGGKILAVGDRTQVMKLQSDKTKIIDVKGKVMVPGFIDAHGHFFQMGVAAFCYRPPMVA